MKRTELNQLPERLTSATLSFSPKGEVYISPAPEKDFPFEKGNVPFELFADNLFFFGSDRYFLYGFREKSETPLYSTSYSTLDAQITLSEGGEGGRILAKDTPAELRKNFKLSTGVIITAATEIEDTPFLIDIKFQASSRAHWLDFVSDCRRRRAFPDFKMVKQEGKYGLEYLFSTHGVEPTGGIEALINSIV